jgi:hypothetical protein
MRRSDAVDDMGMLLGSPTRFSASLVAALLATTPAFRSVLSDRLSLPAALMRFLIAFAVLWSIATITSIALRRSSTSPTDAANPETLDNNFSGVVHSSVGADR